MSNKEEIDFVQEREIIVGERKIIASIKFENKRTSRVAFTRNGVSMTISNYLKAEAKETQIQAFIEWTRKKVMKHPDLIDQYLFQRTYKKRRYS